ncbi:MAG: Alpha/Beta hydrolase protein [Linnemannia gamsii]|nr:MAG: Alpha/Beta hydrolase protein [Linnemannia gamsii]
MIGLFYETGPIHVMEDHKLIRNNNTWANEYSMLFIEQPVGTGYSFVDQGGSGKGSKHKKKSRRGGGGWNDDEGDGDGDDDDTPGFDNEEEDDSEDVRFEELDAELERDQEDEAAFFATLPSRHSYEVKVAATGKRPRGQTGNNSSYAEDPGAMYTKSGYVKDQRAVVEDMMIFLDQFYERYPEQQKTDLYIAGQSYAGKFIPSIAHAIMDRNKKLKAKLPQSGGGKEVEADDMMAMADIIVTHTVSKAAAPPKQVVIPIKGISMGNTMTDPITQIQIHADHAYYLGLITEPQADQMRDYQRSAVELIEQGRYLDANRFRGKIFNLFRNSTGRLNTFDIRKGSHGMNWKPMTVLMNMPEIKDSLNVFGPRKSYLIQHKVPRQEVDRIERGRRMTEYKTDPEVKQAMRGDIMRSTTPLVASLLDNGSKFWRTRGSLISAMPPLGRLNG